MLKRLDGPRGVVQSSYPSGVLSIREFGHRRMTSQSPVTSWCMLIGFAATISLSYISHTSNRRTWNRAHWPRMGSILRNLINFIDRGHIC